MYLKKFHVPNAGEGWNTPTRHLHGRFCSAISCHQPWGLSGGSSKAFVSLSKTENSIAGRSNVTKNQQTAHDTNLLPSSFTI